MELFNLSGAGYLDNNNELVVAPNKVNSMYQFLILQKFVDTQARTAKKP